MNIFRMLGDLAHLLSFFLLVYRLRKTRNASGISLKTQELYFLVFATRYLDLFTSFYSLYNTVMKIFYLVASGYIVYLIRFTEPYRTTYDKSADKFPYLKYSVAPCAVLCLFINEGHFDFSFGGFLSYGFECLWAFSIMLEAIAIIPQLVVLHNDKLVENLTANFVVALGSYRAFYIFNWVYRYMTEPHYRAWLAWVCGVIQTAFYCDFFYYFFISKYHGMKHMPLPQ